MFVLQFLRERGCVTEDGYKDVLTKASILNCLPESASRL